MATSDADRFLKAVEDAEAITKTLKKMKEEVSAYKTASKSLNSVRDELKAQLQETLKISEGISELIKTMTSLHLEMAEALQNNLARLRYLIIYAVVASVVASIIGLVGWFI